MSRRLRATYRLQLAPGVLDFSTARELVPYLRDLGVSHLYLSPSFAAREGSTHGYDVVDPNSLSPALGGESEFRELVRAAHEAGLGVILDIVPNHMATDPANRFWTEQREKFFDIDPVSGRHRRFFDIDHLAGVRQEDPEVFAATHEKVLSLVAEGLVDGLRVDHPDGLADPAGYLDRLRERGVAHVWVGKILDPDEHLREWPVEGTVGYEFLDDVAALFADPAGEAALTELWERVSGDARPFGEWAREAKLEQARTTFQPEVERLQRVAAFDGLEEALASLPVYRTYITPDAPPDEADLEVLEEAGVTRLVEMPPEFVTRFQQTTPPVMAKGVEDTAFYRYARLLALNDVGGDPSRFGIDVARFHAGNHERQARFPRNMLITQTHDTKRSGDVRARIGALAGMADDWAQRVRRWFELCEPLRRGAAPDAVEQYFVFQTLVGAWPLEVERLEAYVEKALREAKRNTNWVEQDHDYEERVKAFCRDLYDHRPFVEDFEPFAARVARVGDRHALGQLLLKLTVPGLPDIYPGDELLSLALVDPDNRRPVDWDRRRILVGELRAGAQPREETRKLALIVRALDLRARRPEAFAGSYEALEAGADVVAFVRGGDVFCAVAVREQWPDAIELPDGRWRDVLRDGTWEGRVELDDHGLALLER
jgi:(1->4)-alpha-D-glucan 1-alpha-D-glucosylmutase